MEVPGSPSWRRRADASQGDRSFPRRRFGPLGPVLLGGGLGLGIYKGVGFIGLPFVGFFYYFFFFLGGGGFRAGGGWAP